MLALNQKVGLLYIQSPTAWKALYFNERGVTLYFNEHTMLDRVLAKLVRGGQISATGVLEAREHAAHQGHQVIDSLLAGGYLTEEELDGCVRTEIEEEIYELFFWHDAKFEFYEGATEYQGREGVIHDQFFFGTDAIIMEAARRIDEWGYITSMVPSGLDVFRAAAVDARAFELPDHLFQVFEHIDGMRNVDRLIEVTGLPPFQIYKTLCALLEDHVIESLPAPELLNAGRDCMIDGRTKDAINLFERAVELRMGIPGVHTQAAEAYRSLGEYEQSCYHTKCIAEHHAANGNLRKAIGLFREVLETIPTDLEACQRVVELSMNHPELATEDFDPLNVGKDLVDLYLEMGEIDRVRSLLEELIREHPADIELKKSLINVHTKVGDTKRVVELYESIAEDLTRGGDPIQAIKYLQKILQLDRARTDISEWIKRLYQVDERKRSRRRSMVALGVVFVLLVAASAGYWFYNYTARQRLTELEIPALLQKKQFKAATGLIEEFIATYPFTMVVQEAREELGRIDRIETANRAAELARRKAKAKKYEQARFEYTLQWQRYLTYFANNEIEKALRAIEKVRKLVAQAGQPKDLLWAQNNKVDSNYMELLTYLTTATRLEKEARAAMDKGDWREQRRLAISLIKDFQLTSVARRAQISVRFVTRPAGALILQDGKPLTGTKKDGTIESLRTPAVVACPNKPSIDFTLRKEGFEDLTTTVSPINTDSVTVVMSMRPMSTLKFAQPALAGPGVSGRGKVAVALRGGMVGISTDGDERVRAVRLPGLSEMDGVPCVTETHLYFATNEGELVCHDLAGGRRIWRTKLTSPLVFNPVMENNRIYVVDRDGAVTCLSASQRGRVLWRQKLEGAASGMPVVFGRSVALGSTLGSVLVIDALKGRITTRLKLDIGVTADVVLNKSFVIFGTEDGRLHAYRRGSGSRSPVWSIPVGRAVRTGELVMAERGEAVFVVGANRQLFKVDVRDGRVLASRRMSDRPNPGMVAMSGRLFVVTRVEQHRRDMAKKEWDVLLSLDPDTLETEWRFSDGGVSLGRLARGSKRLYLTGSRGEVYRVQ